MSHYISEVVLPKRSRLVESTMNDQTDTNQHPMKNCYWHDMTCAKALLPKNSKLDEHMKLKAAPNASYWNVPNVKCFSPLQPLENHFICTFQLIWKNGRHHLTDECRKVTGPTWPLVDSKSSDDNSPTHWKCAFYLWLIYSLRIIKH